MSCISKSFISRRRLLALCAGWPLLAFASQPPPAMLADFRRWGSGDFRRFGFHVYEATLWVAGDDPLKPPLALSLTYKRNITGKDIAQASVKEIRNLRMADEDTLKAWGSKMESLFPDVRPGDRILGLYLPAGARFFHNDRPLGVIEDADFARAFFAIWLDARTSAPELRRALLKSPAG